MCLLKTISIFFIRCDYILIKLRYIVLETINNITFIFNSYFVITAQNWHVHFSFVNFVLISRTITYTKYQQKNGTLSAPKTTVVVWTINRWRSLRLTIVMLCNFLSLTN